MLVLAGGERARRPPLFTPIQTARRAGERRRKSTCVEKKSVHYTKKLKTHHFLSFHHPRRLSAKITGSKTASTPAFQVRRTSARAPRPKSGSSAGIAWKKRERGRNDESERR